MYNQSMLKADSLKNKTILITGGGTGLGKSMAAYFSELGADIVIASRRFEVVQATALELEKNHKCNVLPVACDVRKYTDIQELRERINDRFGRLDVLVNNAAGNFISPTERLSHRAFDIIVDIVLKGSYNCTLAFGKEWIKNQTKGTILNIVTTYASTGSGYVVPSAAAKAGVLAMTRSLAVEWAKYGIRSNAIAPGPFPTEGAWSRLFPKEVSDKLNPLDRIPLKRFGEHQELANLAAYLVSDYSAYINGEVITIDGGEWLNGAGEFNYLDKIPGVLWDEISKAVKNKK